MNGSVLIENSVAFAAVLVPAAGIVVIQKRRGAPASWRIVGVAAAVYLAALAVLALPQLEVVEGLRYNWQNKLLLAALIVALLSRSTADFRTRCGIVPPSGAWTIPATISLAVILIIAMYAGLAVDDPRPLTAETIWFQATVPGLDEELLYRGLLFALFGVAFGLQKRAGYWFVLVLVTVLFALVHAIHWDGQSLEFSADPFAGTLIVGFWFGWARLYTGSVFPAVILHNVYNVVFNVAASL
jgi:membrane protease YdiL (CAAX protease family)